ncbi:MAG: TetR/AcrR family transcriptional regulator [Acidobacteriota bacterium]
MSPTHRTGRSDEPRRRILDAAIEVFAERGFAGAGVDEIARRAGINKAMLYYHIGDKAALYATVVIETIELIRTTIQENMEGQSDPRDRLRALLGAFLSVVQESPRYPQMMLRELADGWTNLPPEALQRLTGVLAITRAILDDGRESGELRDVNPLLTHLLVVGSVLFMSAAQRLRGRAEALGIVPSGTPTAPEGLLEFLSDVLLNGIAEPQRFGGKSWID